MNLIAADADWLRNAKRILVIGSPGSGKSTLSQRLAAMLDLPYIPMDREFFWLPGWEMRTRDEARQLIAEAVTAERWLIDGTGANSLDLRLPHAELVIWLKLPRALCLWRVVRRWIRFRGTSRPDMPEDCQERLDMEFIRYIWNFQHDVEPAVIQKIDELAPQLPVMILQSPSDISGLLAHTKRAL